MNRARFGELEVLCRTPAGTARPTPLLFVHGAYTAAWCWDENFLPWFAEQGYAAYAVSLSGHGGSRGRAYLDSFSIADYVADVADVVAQLPAPPVLIGHSMGGMVVQKFLERQSAPGVVLMSSVPPQGLLGSAFGLAFSRPHLLGDLNRIMGGGRPQMETLRDAMFHETMEIERLQREIEERRRAETGLPVPVGCYVIRRHLHERFAELAARALLGGQQFLGQVVALLH